MTNAVTVVFTSQAEVVSGFTTVLAHYRASGLSSIGYRVTSETALTTNLYEVGVTWHHRDASRQARFQDTYRYLLRRTDDGVLRIHVAIVIDA